MSQSTAVNTYDQEATLSKRELLAPYGVIALIIVGVFSALLILGLNLGFFGDILQFQYVLDSLGIRPAMRWFSLEAFTRHPFASHHYAMVHLLFGDQSIGWYATSIFYHLLTAIPVFLLIDTILRYKYRWFTFAVTLLFLFHTRQYVSLFGDAFSGFVRISLALELLSLWMYLHYVRGRRQNHWWRDFSIIFYLASINLYETTMGFVLLNWFIAYWEDQRNQTYAGFWRWNWQVFKDTFLYGVLGAAYLYYLIVYFPNTAVQVSPSSFIPELIRLFTVEYGSSYFERLFAAFSSDWIVVTLAIGVLAFVVLWWFSRGLREEGLSRTRRIWIWMILFGIGMMLLNALLAVQIAFLPADTPRIVYPFQVGFALVLMSVFALILTLIPNAVLRRFLYSVLIALITGASVTALFIQRQAVADENIIRERVLNAVIEAVPDIADDATPYFVLLTDDEFQEAMIQGLHARDANFSRHFALLYGIDVDADVFYLDLPDSSRPATDVDAERYVGPFIVVNEDGIYSPLRPLLPEAYDPADPTQMIILYFDPGTDSVTILDEVPSELLERANILEQIPIEWETNFNLIQE